MTRILKIFNAFKQFILAFPIKSFEKKQMISISIKIQNENCDFKEMKVQILPEYAKYVGDQLCENHYIEL